MLPLGTLLEFDEFDNKLREKEFASRVVHFMKTLGGKDTHDFLFNALKRCLSNSVAKEYSMDSKKKKKPLRPTYFLRTMLEAAKMHRAESDEDLAIKIISSWLAGAKLRFDRETAKLGVIEPEQEQRAD
ncbi:uncharacterized protein [Neodiprion pinetum]|uniref:uncharacterized protein n=1 Tax=Neodiprion pinetum TaxID=441929 RepID=UPI00371868CE